MIELLKLNKVELTQLKKDTTIEVEVYRIDDYKTAARQYEMHHPNSDVKVSTNLQKMNFRKGDYYIPMNQVANHFLIETLEPQAQEDIATEYLKNYPAIKTKLEQRRATDSVFAKSGRDQLNFVFQNSSYFEPVNMRYPVYRVIR